MMGTIIGTAGRTTGARSFAIAVGLAAAALTVSAGPAAATGTRVGVEPGISFGSATNYGTGCSYTVNGYVDDPSTPVIFYDNAVPFAWAYPSGGLAQAQWKPATTGAHRLQIFQQNRAGTEVFPYVDVTAGTGLSTGSGCNVFG
ncbi:hypothetical protein LTV02_38325 [Nocardia yamanashiensis]|uniref:hypothetical protein n=1 Tax=Nocardia yamanashiensis TaxID=209247 RepID=UPI000A8EDAFD|nr:hypothetical protein [Nocardia yamanashiensis]UGT41704.1 hypothetical protein LTV02_38325 [Nocardia yamanashiensis]